MTAGRPGDALLLPSEAGRAVCGRVRLLAYHFVQMVESLAPLDHGDALRERGGTN